MFSARAKMPLIEETIMANTEALSIFDLPADADAEAAADSEADAEVEAGLGIPHDRVREWLLKLAEGEILAPPIA